MSCFICGKREIGRYTPDLDIRGVGFCKKHKDDVFYRIYETIFRAEKRMSKVIKKKNNN